jgi:carbonic anhydrase
MPTQRLIEAIIQANTRAAGGDKSAGLRPEEFADALPLVALTCIDARLNPLIPEVLGVPETQFIWLRNAGNIITGPLSSTLRSMALACLVKGGKEIVVIGHTDCLVGKSTMLKLTDAMKNLGIDRARLPENLIEYFGMFSSERQNVMKAVEHIRNSPLISPAMPIHGLLVDIQTGRLELLVNGYQALDTTVSKFTSTIRKAEVALGPLEDLPQFKIGSMEFPSSKIGDAASHTKDFLKHVETSGEKASQVYEQVRGNQYGDNIGQATGTRGSEQIGTHPSEKPYSAESRRPIGEQIGEKISDFIDQKLGVSQPDENPIESLKRKIDPNRRYNLIGSDQKKYGPVAGRIVQQWLGDTRIDANTPVQLEGADTWQTLGSLTEVAKSNVRLPPPISSAVKQFKGKRW